jgi:hypothetical protein
MSCDLVTAGLEGFDVLSLAELDAVAALRTRTDRKYVVEPDRVAWMLAAIAGSARVLEINGLRTFEYESVYFDTPDFDSYMGTARRRRRRFKVRTRSYLDSADCAFEIKLRDHRGQTVKHRRPHDVRARERLTDEARAFLASFPTVAPIACDLAPTLRTSYRRSTLVVGANRVTLDTELTCRRLGHSTQDASGLDRLVVVETKTSGPACPVDHLLWRMHVRPVPLSKYGTGLAALDRDLPANKWHRTLERHVTVGTPSHPSLPIGRQLP